MAKTKEDKDNGAVGTKKKGPPLLIIMVAIAVVSAGGCFIIVKKSSASANHPAKKVKVEQGPVLQLDEFLVNLADANGDHFLKVSVGLELSKEKGKTPEGMKEDIAPIRDAVLTCLNSKNRQEVSTNAGRDKLKTEILKRVNAALGEDDVESVYFTNFVTQ